MKKIIINADDLGLSAAVNEAVCALGEQGRIQSTSLMSLGILGTQELRRLNTANIEIGLHLDFTGLAGIGSLKSVILRSWLRTWNPAKLGAIICHQFDEFEDKVGCPPRFIDGHQHIHQFPQIRETLLAETEKRYGRQPALRSTRTRSTDLKSQMIYRLGGRRFDYLLARQHWKSNQQFGGVYGFDGTIETLRHHWQRWLFEAADNELTVIMCHPAVSDNAWHDEIRTAREREWAWLGSAEFQDLYRESGAQPSAWRDCR